MSAFPQSVAQMSLSELQAAFLAMQPRILAHARIYFRGVRCSERKADYIAETLALCWKWFRNLARRGKDARLFVSALAGYATRAVRSGRRICGQLKPNDVMSERAQQQRNFRVESLPLSTRTSFDRLYGTLDGQHQLDVLEERLQHNTMTPVDEQVAFRFDFPAWMRTRTWRDRRIIRDMARNERTSILARKFKISPARISQLRREFHDDWVRFTSDLAEIDNIPPTIA